MLIEYSRMPPSSWAEETRKTFDHWGQGLVGARESGGRGTISNWWTLLQPWRWTVPRQSAPVSPPPMMITCLSVAVSELAVDCESPATRRFWSGQEVHREVDPLEVAPLDRQVARLGRAAAEADGVELGEELLGRDVDADVRARA